MSHVVTSSQQVAEASPPPPPTSLPQMISDIGGSVPSDITRCSTRSGSDVDTLAADALNLGSSLHLPPAVRDAAAWERQAAGEHPFLPPLCS